MAAEVPAIVTADALLRFDPLMVTWVVPAGPLVGVKPLIAGAGGVTVNEAARPFLSPAGTVAVILMDELTVKVAAVP